MIAVASAVLPLAAVIAAKALFNVQFDYLTTDVTSLGGLNPLAGALSSIGILLWWSSASIWTIAALVHQQASRRDALRFALASAALSGYLAIDDLFRIHETLAPRYLGLSQTVVYAGLLLATGAYLLGFARTILRAYPLLLLLALALLGLSVFVDVLPDLASAEADRWKTFAEESLKWVGIVAWLSFCMARCRFDLQGAHAAIGRHAAGFARQSPGSATAADITGGLVAPSSTRGIDGVGLSVHHS